MESDRKAGRQARLCYDWNRIGGGPPPGLGFPVRPDGMRGPCLWEQGGGCGGLAQVWRTSWLPEILFKPHMKLPLFIVV